MMRMMTVKTSTTLTVCDGLSRAVPDAVLRLLAWRLQTTS